MSVASKSIHRAVVTLGIPRKNADVILYATNIVQKITNNSKSPTPSLCSLVMMASCTVLNARSFRVLGETSVKAYFV